MKYSNLGFLYSIFLHFLIYFIFCYHFPAFNTKLPETITTSAVIFFADSNNLSNKNPKIANITEKINLPDDKPIEHHQDQIDPIVQEPIQSNDIEIIAQEVININSNDKDHVQQPPNISEAILENQSNTQEESEKIVIPDLPDLGEPIIPKIIDKPKLQKTTDKIIQKASDNAKKNQNNKKNIAKPLAKQNVKKSLKASDPFGSSAKKNQIHPKEQRDIFNLDNTNPGTKIAEKLDTTIEEQLIFSQIMEKWNNIWNNSQFIVKLQLKIDPDGNILSWKVLESQCAKDVRCESIILSAERAARLANPFTGLDPSRYDIWKDVIITFTPSNR